MHDTLKLSALTHVNSSALLVAPGTVPHASSCARTLIDCTSHPTMRFEL
jgi:hypothetical protein